MKKTILLLFAGSSLLACKESSKNTSPQPLAVESITETEQQEGEWQYLFDGSNAEGWRGYNSQEGLPEGWVVEDGTLKSLGHGGDIGGDIVYRKEEFGEFELSLEWKLSKGGNSGIFYHVVEDDQFGAPYYTAPEYQIIDQKGFPEKLEPWQSIGGDYGMYDPSYSEEDLKEIGEWNTSRIVFTENKVTYWLNGKKTVEFDPWSDDWKQRKQKGKWSEFPEYGTAGTGFIGLQDHGSNVWFKNIKIRKL